MSESLVFYKYMDASGIDLLRNLRLLAKPPGLLNDPFECNPAMRATTDPLEIRAYLESPLFRMAQLKSGKTATKPQPVIIADLVSRAQQILAEARQSFEQDMAEYRMACMSKRCDGILLWSHYASAHSGFVVGLRATLIGGHSQRAIIQVNYSPERPDLGGVLSPRKLEFEDKLFSTLRTKSEDWKYEEEVRIVGPAEAFETVEGNSFVPLDPSAIECVIYGLRILPALREQIGEVLGADPRLSHVRQLQARVDDRRFMMQVVPA